MVLHEIHEKGKSVWNDNWNSCQCSYCTGTQNYNKLHYGLNIPKNWKGWNSWWVIKYGNGRYIRWIWGKLLKCFN